MKLFQNGRLFLPFVVPERVLFVEHLIEREAEIAQILRAFQPLFGHNLQGIFKQEKIVNFLRFKAVAFGQIVMSIPDRGDLAGGADQFRFAFCFPCRLKRRKVGVQPVKKLL